MDKFSTFRNRCCDIEIISYHVANLSFPLYLYFLNSTISWPYPMNVSCDKVHGRRKDFFQGGK